MKILKKLYSRIGYLHIRRNKWFWFHYSLTNLFKSSTGQDF